MRQRGDYNATQITYLPCVRKINIISRHLSDKHIMLKHVFRKNACEIRFMRMIRTNDIQKLIAQNSEESTEDLTKHNIQPVPWNTRIHIAMYQHFNIHVICSGNWPQSPVSLKGGSLNACAGLYTVGGSCYALVSRL